MDVRIKTNERLLADEGGNYYLIRDVWINSDLVVQYAVVGDYDKVCWTTCKEGSEFSALKPFIYAPGTAMECN